MKNWTLRAMLAFAAIAFLTGCGNPYGGDMSLIDVNHGSPGSAPLPAGKGTEFVSSSQQNALSSNGTHRFYATLGSPANALYVSGTGGHLLFSNVQGELLSTQPGF